MDKNQWNLENIKSFKCKSYIICNECGWFISDPSENDLECLNCGNSYKLTNSIIQGRIENGKI